MKNKLKVLKTKQVLIVSLFLLFVLSTVSVGYALYNEELKVDGAVSLIPEGMVEITNVSVSSENNIVNLSNDFVNKFTTEGCGNTFNMSTNISAGSYGQIIYQITFKNNSNISYTYNGISYNDTLDATHEPRIYDIRKGYVLESGESVTVNVIYYYEEAQTASAQYDAQTIFRWLTGEQDVSYKNLQVTFKSGTEYTIDDTVDNGTAHVQMKVANLNDVSVKYVVKLSNSDIEIRNKNNKKTTFTNYIEPGNSDTQNLYLKVLDDSDTVYKTNVIFEFEDGRIETVEDVIVINVPSKYSFSFSVSKYSSWDSHYTLNFDVSNNYTTDLTSWTLYITLKDDIYSYANYTTFTEAYDPSTRTITINNINKYNTSLKTTMPAGKTYTFPNSITIGCNSTFDVNSIESARLVTTAETPVGTSTYWSSS